MSRLPKLSRFKNEIQSKYEIFNGIFMTLPFDNISNTGGLLPLFHEICVKGYEAQQNPTQIIQTFFDKFMSDATDEERRHMLFSFIQYIERQVVLFDAIEDAGYRQVNNMDGRGTLRQIKEEAEELGKLDELNAYLQKLSVRPVLTAHPTQFYPGEVLAIINDLSKAIQDNELDTIKALLAQLGKTPFFKKEKPTPYDEAVSLIWFLEHVFYKSIGQIYDYLNENVLQNEVSSNSLINIGFWPGGDRDGNPFVTTEITLKVAQRLRTTLIKNYYRDLRVLRRRITFRGTQEILRELEQQVYAAIFDESNDALTVDYLLEKLQEVKDVVVNEHQGLYEHLISSLINKINLFGLHFATLDIRQDSSIHEHVFDILLKEATHNDALIFPENYKELSIPEKIEVLTTVKGTLEPGIFKDEYTQRTLSSIYAIKKIQASNGERGCHRYIISNTQEAVHILEVFAMLSLCDWQDPTVDVVPLFETVPDLIAAPEVMEQLYSNTIYRKHLEARGNTQTIMLGFSDGTKDGGYLMANWSIYKAKEALTQMSRKYGVTVLFFDGRGGPPARGGGKTHQFYASLGPNIEAQEIQVTIQGQTISSNFGTLDSCQYNLEQLLSSGVRNQVFADNHGTITPEDRETMEALAAYSYEAYTAFKKHPNFLGYLERMSTLKYYAKTNIGSRPSKRGKSTTLEFKDLRAIPFVGSWSQLKQNVPGFYGVGTAIKAFEKRGELDKVKQLYKNSAFFKTLLENSMMSLTKSFFGLTAYMQDDPEFGDFWKIIFTEYEDSKRLMLEVAGISELMENEKAGKASIQARENIVLPLLTIQQYALRAIQVLQKEEPDSDLLPVFEKMVTRSLYGNINASRNSA